MAHVFTLKMSLKRVKETKQQFLSLKSDELVRHKKENFVPFNNKTSNFTFTFLFNGQRVLIKTSALKKDLITS